MTKPDAPDPTGPKPDNWDQDHWDAYTIWSQGGKRTEAALASGFSVGWIGTLVRRWKDTYNVDHLDYRKPGLPEGAQALGVQASATTRRLAWLERRHDLQTNIGGTITETGELLDAFLSKVKQNAGEDDVIITAQDFRALTLGLKDLVGIADRLALDPTVANEGPTVNLNFGELPDTVNAALDSIDALPDGAGIIDIDLAEEA